MKRYWLFVWAKWEGSGGLNDLRSTSDNIELLNKWLSENYRDAAGDLRWCIYDSETETIIKDSINSETKKITEDIEIL